MRETRILEFKETITNIFLKTVSAFSNYNGGHSKTYSGKGCEGTIDILKKSEADVVLMIET